MFENSKWIGMGESYRNGISPVFYHRLDIEEEIESARVHVTGLGFYELYINGMKVGEQVLAPVQTNYEERVYFDTFDVTGLLEKENGIGIMLGDGWYHQYRVWRNPKRPEFPGELTEFSYSCNLTKEQTPIYGNPVFLLELTVTTKSGKTVTLVSDESWVVSMGPVILNNVYTGEVYDGRFEIKDWAKAEMNTEGWRKAKEEQGPSGKLISMDFEPIKKVEEIPVKSMTKVTNGVYLFDMGVNFAGWIRIQGIGFEGMELRIRYGERLRNDQDLLYGNYHQVIWHCIQEDRFICGKDGYYQWEPRFTNHGFRYVEISGMSHPMKEEDVMGIRVNTAFRQMGNFSCDNQLLNQFHKMADNSFLSNMQGIPMDCPIRERCGWGGDAIVIAESLLYNYSAKEFLRKFVWDMISSRLVFGEWKNVAPGRRGSGKACAAWGSAVVTIAWDCYWFSGDKAMLQDVYPYMKLWVDELANQAESYIIKEGLDDWAQPDERKLKGLSTSAQISTAYYYLSAKLLSESAGELGYEQDKENYRLLSEEIKKALKEKYYKNGTFGGQGIDAMAVCEDLLDEDEVRVTTKKLAEDILEHDKHFIVGHVGMKYICRALGRNGYFPLLMEVLEQKGYPGLRHMVDKGATSIWERWGGDADCDENFRGGSLNHGFKGGYDAWLYSDVLGICPVKPGFEEVSICPQAMSLIKKAEGSYTCVKGNIKVSYVVTEGKLNFWVQIPKGVKAYIKMGNHEKVLENGGTWAEYSTHMTL